LSLGDFTMVNVARRALGKVAVNDHLYVAMIRSLISEESKVAALAPNPEALVFACAGADDEVAYVWSNA
jgi:hypothetical protein